MSETASAGGERPQLLTVGSLPRVHGVRGEMKLKASVEHVALLRGLAETGETITLRMPDSGDEFEVTFGHVRGADSAPIIAIDGVDGREGAEGFHGAIVLVDRSHLTPPDEDEYFLGDLDGCIAHDTASGTPIGKVVRVESLPANVVLYVRMQASGKNVLVPFADIAVPHVDVEARRIDVDLAYLGVDITGAELP